MLICEQFCFPRCASLKEDFPNSKEDWKAQSLWHFYLFSFFHGSENITAEKSAFIEKLSLNDKWPPTRISLKLLPLSKSQGAGDAQVLSVRPKRNHYLVLWAKPHSCSRGHVHVHEVLIETIYWGSTCKDFWKHYNNLYPKQSGLYEMLQKINNKYTSSCFIFRLNSLNSSAGHFRF